MRSRTVELGLLVLASLITISAYGLLALGQTDELPTNIMAFMVGLLTLIIGAHVVVRRVLPGADPLLLPLAALLNGIGYVFISRIDPEFASRQAAWSVVGLVAFLGVVLIINDVRRLEQYRYTLAVGGLVLLLLPLVPRLGVVSNGARIWIRFAGFSIQPGEFAKLAFAMFLAGYLVDKRELLAISTIRIGRMNVPEVKHFAPLVLAWGVALMVMVYQRDLGLSLLFFTLFVVMLYVATSRAAYVLIGGTLFVSGAFVAHRMFSHVQRRVEAWLGAFENAKDSGYQVAEASFALADGGVTGTGLGFSSLGHIPALETDMIFVVIGQELGLLGATAILATYLLFCGAGFRIAINAASTFERLLAVGLTALLGFQAFIIIGGILRVVPLTGVTLPFVSYGGSSLVSNYILLAILMRISHRSSQAAVRT